MTELQGQEALYKATCITMKRSGQNWKIFCDKNLCNYESSSVNEEVF